MDKIEEKFFLDGILICYPKKQETKRKVLEIILKRFEVNYVYSEKEVNDILKKVYSDYILIRRSLVESNLLKRTDDGSAYWRYDNQ